MSVSDLDPPGVADRAKDLGTVLVARWLIPSNPANLVVELVRESLGCRLRGDAVNEREFQSFGRTVRARSSSICSTALASDVEAGTTLTQSGSPVTSTQTMRLEPLVRP
jgi:hypothetical protein